MKVLTSSASSLLSSLFQTRWKVTRCFGSFRQVQNGDKDYGIDERKQLFQNCLIPIGALTSKPYAFTARSWELKSTSSVDVLDGVGSNIRVDTRGYEVMRILPVLNENVNEEWISDKTRFSYDGLKRQRLSVPFIRLDQGQLVPTTWEKARAILKNEIIRLEREYVDKGGFEAQAVIGPQVEVEALLQFRRQFLYWFPGGSIHLQERRGAVPHTDFREDYLLNSTLPGIETADVILLVGTNPRTEAPLLNTRIRKAVLYNQALVASVGCYENLTYPVEHLGISPKTLREIAEGRHSFCVQLALAKRPAILVGNRALQRDDGENIYQMVKHIAEYSHMIREDWNGFNVVHTGANTVGALDIGFDSKYRGLRTIDCDRENPWRRTKFLYLLNADDIDGLDQLPQDCFVVYQGHHGDYGASIANLILPGAAYTEKNGTFVNMEGRVQHTNLAFIPPYQAKEDAEILHDLVFPDLVLDIPQMGVEVLAPHLLRSHQVQSGDPSVRPRDNMLQRQQGESSTVPFGPPIENFYMTDPITRSSKTMAKCTRVQQLFNFDG
ncbi:NADH-ubiquinone oxidoreductase 75 kDa subunit [Galdieria sulphuraria]|uniref:NADH dehydrogenase (Ubiquinone) Fe-S protein 1 n=1 Tax=Galdieria sulphuraria TaxID=130081 RepID=M2XZF7_GALSU|nr:NADH dehydrogenase (ubiquinone) Fe-S protein 1 [Galdieria sulphuraria]EME28959.1 NADH dehydrogenase (ubiquinone) Fe-S protein 1 [Galdieria sulphuraria]GJD06895.1 NADH-ubiquinone oxidoreductase 75 kDa subunit [Galdieria sulphuraria]|eukprot:XP_005705479.1 NADH dehydrogenase (ubiquinone) Fe-S protein 1 [Galdieria sulphuraria]